MNVYLWLWFWEIVLIKNFKNKHNFMLFCDIYFAFSTAHVLITEEDQ